MKKSLRDLWWMLVPVLVLVGAGYAYRNRTGPRVVGPEPWRLTVEAVSLEELTPLEVSEGWDTKLVVSLGHRGQMPGWWKKSEGARGSRKGTWQVVHSAKGKSRAVKLPSGASPEVKRWQAWYDHADGVYKVQYLTKLEPIPAGDELRLRDRVAIVNNAGRAVCPPVWLDTKIRARGRRTTTPTVSRDTGFVLERQELDTEPLYYFPGKRLNYQAKFTITVKDSDPSGMLSGEFFLVDARGRQIVDLGENPQLMQDVAVTPKDKTLRRRVYDFTMEPLRKAAPPRGPLWLVGRLYINDNWARPVRMPFSDKSGRVLITSRSEPDFCLNSVNVAPASDTEIGKFGADTVVRATVVATGKSKTPINFWTWDGEHSAHVVDGTGKRYWTFPLKHGAMPAFAVITIGRLAPAEAMKPATSAKLTCLLNLSMIPKSAGRLTFKTDISANGSRRVPVSVVVRN